jgi:hypothetical protein
MGKWSPRICTALTSWPDDLGRGGTDCPITIKKFVVHCGVQNQRPFLRVRVESTRQPGPELATGCTKS